MKKEERKCPLSIVDWVNYLASEQNRERFVFYNEILSVLTIFIVLLTVLNCFLILNSILFTFSFLDASTKNILYICTWGVLFSILIIIGYLFFNKLPKSKNRMNEILDNEGSIIEDILKGKETDTQKILERYDSIWKNKRNIL